MLTFTGRRNLFGDLSNNTTSANLTLGDTLIANSDRELLAKRPWHFRQRTQTISMIGSAQTYNLAFNNEKVITVSVQVSSTTYTPKEAVSREKWNEVNYAVNTRSDTPEWYFIFNKQMSFYPTPNSSTGTATVAYEINQRDLSVADYSTGNIESVTNGTATIVGTATSWTAPMAGRFLRITESNTAASSGDHQWYEISSITNGTTLILTRPYDGRTLAAGAGGSYTIGQASVIPEDFQILPVYRALEIYFSSVQPDLQKAALYKGLYNEGYQNMVAQYGSRSSNVHIEDDYDDLVNPNLIITA